MATRKMPTYEVVSGCIQEGRQVFVAGQEYTPPNATLEKQLMEQGGIVRARPATKAPAASEDETAPAGDEQPQGDETTGPDLLSDNPAEPPADEPAQEP